MMCGGRGEDTRRKSIPENAPSFAFENGQKLRDESVVAFSCMQTGGQVAFQALPKFNEFSLALCLEDEGSWSEAFDSKIWVVEEGGDVRDEKLANSFVS